MGLKFTLLFHLHQETELERSSARFYDEALALIRQADALPIEIAWLAEHHFLDTRGRLPAPLLMAVAVARETRRIGVGPCVIQLPLHHPLDVAEQIAVADLLCGGRLAVGVGSGGNPEEFAAYDVPVDGRRERFAEGLTVLSKALNGGPFSFEGAHYRIPRITLVPPLMRSFGHLLWVAASSPESATLAGRSGGSLLLPRGAPISDLLDLIEVYRAARVEAGFGLDDARIQVTRGVYVADDSATARAEAEQGVRRHYERLARYRGEEVDVSEMARRGDFIIGTPAQCVEQVRALGRALPITHLACDIGLIGAPLDKVARSLDLLGLAVIPRARAG